MFYANNGQVDRDEELRIIEYMSKVTGVKYSDEQLNILKTHGGMCILASAGSGKTTILNNLIAKRIQTGELDPDKLLCTTFSKSGANEMETRLTQLLKLLGVRGSVNVRTLHSLYYSLLKDLQYSLTVIDNGKKLSFIREAAKNCGLTLEDDEVQTIDSILSYQVNNLMSDQDVYRSYIFTLRDKVTLDTYVKIRTDVNSKKKSAGVIDFDDMQLLIYQILRSETYGPAMVRYVRSLWEHIYIDEAQDISKIQFAILKKLVGDPNKLVIIGDDDQCIYQWRGADPSIILNICGIYPELTRVTLTTNYRCLSNIVDRAAHGIKFNQVRSDKSMVAFANGGDIKFCDTGKSNIYEMSKYAYKYIEDLVIKDGVNPSDIAVLARNNQHLTVLGNMLFKNGIFCSQPDDVKFSRVGLYKIISSAFDIGSNTTNGNVVGDNLWKYAAYLNKKTSRDIGNIQSTYGLSVRDCLGLVLKEFCKVGIDWDNPGIKVSKFDHTKYTGTLSILRGETIGSLVAIYDILNREDATKACIGILKMFLTTKVDFFYKNEVTKRFAEGYVQYMCYLLSSLGFSNFKRYIKSVEQFETGKMAVMSPMVTLSTMHGAKGKEWKYVLIFADDNLSFPCFSNIDDCIKNGVPDVDVRRMIDEDRRLHYVAMTRAKEHLTIFADKTNLSVYTMEAFDIMNYGNSNNTHIITMAQHGLYDKLVAQSSALFDSEDSKIAIGISHDWEDDSKASVTGIIEPVENNGCGINLSNIQTYAPVIAGE